MGRPRSWTDEQLLRAVQDSNSLAGVLRALGLSATGANYKHVRSHIERLSLDVSHHTGQGWRTGRTDAVYRRPLTEVLVRNSDYTNTGSLKRRLLSEGYLDYACSRCGVVDWNNEPLALQLEHKNGDNRDNRLCNLCLLCPNCHSQTDTFCRRK